MKREAVILSLVCVCLGSLDVRGETRYIEPESRTVRDKLEWFQDQKLCLMMHFGLYSLLGITESWPLSTQDAMWARADVEWTDDDAEFKRQYFALARCFNPIRFDARAIARTARRCGFRYVTFTTKHHDGFCLWDTKSTGYKTTSPSCPYSSSGNADIVKRLFDACRAEGLGVGAYFSKPDFHNEDFWEDCGIGRATTRYPTYRSGSRPEKWERFRSFTKEQILELVRGYGPIDVLWLDGNWIDGKYGWDLGIGGIVDAAREIQPDLISVDRGACNEYMNVDTPEQTVPAAPLGHPWESCITMADGWGYHYDDEYKSPRELVHLLVDVVAKGGNLALNVGPMPDGRLPRPAVERMEALGEWLAKNGEAIYGTRAVKPYSRGKWRYTRSRRGRVFATVLWGVADERCSRVLMPDAPEIGEVVGMTHLATGRSLSFVHVVGDMENGVVVELPHDFRHDRYADSFAVDFKPLTQQKGQPR